MNFRSMAFVKSYLDIPSLDPEDARRRKLLNILLAGVIILSLFGVLGLIFLDIGNVNVSNTPDIEEAQVFKLLYATATVLIAGALILIFINRNYSGHVASSFFLAFLILVFLFSDEPVELISGRSLFFFALPILMASVLIRSYASFIAAAVIIASLNLMALITQIPPNLFANLGFIAVATISWMSARSLEQALVDLRTVNRELDHRVAERTEELSEALSRERSEASKNQAILESIADGVILFDNEGKAAAVNPAIARLLDMSETQIIEQEIEDLSRRVSSPDLEPAAIAEKILRPERGSPNLRLQFNQRILSMNVAPVREAQRGKIGTVAVFRDITREAEVERMKDTFLAMVSHELRTPLNAILGYTEMLNEGVYGQISDQQAEVTQRVWTNSHRLLDLVSDLLDQAQIQSGTLTFQNKLFQPSELLDAMHTVLDKIAADKRLTLSGWVEDSMPDKVTGDPRRIQQIMINLVNNAIKFTDRGGIIVRLYQDDETYWCLEVSDTGRGIAPDVQKYIFEPFRQGESTTTREHGGIGLGLSIVKRLVDIMGGDIELKSAVGAGSVFTVYVPVLPAEKERKNDR